MQDRYGNQVTTSVPAAHAAYCEGIDAFLAAQPGGIAALRRAIELDGSFALAHADLARALQILAQPGEATQQMALAREHSQSLDGQERAHIQIMGHLLAGKGALAFDAIKSHIVEYPRDVMTVQPCCGVFGLIGFSGRVGREQENADFMAALHPHYEGDWWFESQYAFALCEVGALADAETLNELAFVANPLNANAVHHRAHIHYEAGEFNAGRKALSNWRGSYSREGILHCHLAWHAALWSLAAGDIDQLWQIVENDILPDVALAPPINVMTDLVAVLLRAELAGVAVDEALWRTAVDYAHRSFPRPGMSFADAHSVVACARTGADDWLAPFSDDPKGAAGDQVAALALAFGAYAEQDWAATLNALEGVLATHERLGGSRAQRDLLELTQAHTQRKLNLDVTSLRVRKFL